MMSIEATRAPAEGQGWPRPTLGPAFYKAHGLGNDYLVFEEGSAWTATPAAVERICHRTRGVGSDGIVVLLAPGDAAPFRLRMFNPDGSEFERSGNGLRVLASYLHRTGRVGADPFEVEVGGSTVGMTVHAADGGRYDVSVRMGRAESGPTAVGMDPTAAAGDGGLEGPGGERLEVVPVRVGNPHLVVFGRPLDDAELGRIGPFLCAHPALERGANVQLAEPVSEGEVRALIWERGVGRTSSSGTSACAVAVASTLRGSARPGHVAVLMEGGRMEVTVTGDLEVTLRGPVESVCAGELTVAPGRDG